MAKTSLGYTLNKHSVAQSFFIDETNGVYVTKIQLFFSAKDANLPVHLELRPMVNGSPSSFEIIPGSQVTVNSSDVATSADASSATTFQFVEPIFLNGQTDYAISINAATSTYKVWVAEVDQFVIGGTEKKINRQPVSGSLFLSSNNVTFTASQNEDLCFKLFTASFTKSPGVVKLTNPDLGRRKLIVDPLTCTSGSSTIRVSYINSGLQVGQTVLIQGATTMGGISTANLNGARNIVKVDWTGFTYAAGGSASSDAIGGGSDVTVSRNIPYSVMFPNLAYIQPKTTLIDGAVKTTTARSYAGSETAFSKSGDLSTIRFNQNNFLVGRRLVANDSAEHAEMSGNKSFEMQINMSTRDSSVSPMIDLQRTSVTFIDNLIDKQDSSSTTGFNVPIAFANETTKVGSSAAKHLSRVIQLETDAVGLKIILSANKPAEADFQVFFRTATSDEDINDKGFSLVAPENTPPSDDSLNVFREYRYLAGKAGGDLAAFTKFQIKIVFRSTNQAKVPMIRELRVIALST